MSFNIFPVASGYQEIHPYSAMNIDSVKINTSLIMMRECIVLHGIALYHCWLRRAGCISQDTYLLYCYCYFRKILESSAASSLLIQISIHSDISAGTPFAAMLIKNPKCFERFIKIYESMIH